MVVAKLVAAGLAGSAFWTIATLLDVGAGVVFFAAKDLPNHLGDWEVIRSLLLNPMVYVLWGVFGIGLGALSRNQLAATLVGAIGYLVGGPTAQAFFHLVHTFWIKKEWVLTVMVMVPSHAATIAVTPIKTDPERGVVVGRAKVAGADDRDRGRCALRAGVR